MALEHVCMADMGAPVPNSNLRTGKRRSDGAVQKGNDFLDSGIPLHEGLADTA
jgi:hypothetical protein